MFPFEDTKLLRHPTVEKAYNEMRKFFSDGDDFAKEAVRAGELMTAHCKTPDPDAIAASVLLGGMVIRYQSSAFTATVSPRAAEILENMYAFDPEEPVFKSAAEQQIVLAHSAIGLDQIYGEIKSGNVAHQIEYMKVERALKANEKSLLKIIENPLEMDMAAVAVEKLLVTKSVLEDMVRKTQAGLAFEKTGLPEHPLVRDVYEQMKAWDLDGHPLGGYTQTNGAIARVIVETGASSDPEVISAALLNQYCTTVRGAMHPSEFSPRIGALWEESSAWARKGDKVAEAAPSPEGKLIRHAAHIYFLESMSEDYRDPKYAKDISVEALEQLEEMKDKVDADIQEQTHPGLLVRLQRASADANALMTSPENLKIRKPGSPRQEPGW